jgi:hypothetical protein
VQREAARRAASLYLVFIQKNNNNKKNISLDKKNFTNNKNE